MIWSKNKESLSAEDEVVEATSDPGAAPPPGDVESVLSERVESILEAAEQAAAGIRAEAEEHAERYLDMSKEQADDVAAERIRQISELTDTLVERVRAVAQQSDELIAALDDAGRRVMESSSQAPPVPPPTQPMQQLPPQAPQAVPYVAAPQPPPSQPMHQAWPGAPAQPPVPPAPQAPAYPAPPQAYPPPQAQPPGLYPPPAAYPPPAPSTSAPPQHYAPGPPPQPAPEPPNGARLLASQMAIAGSSREEIAWRLQEEFGIEDSSAILEEIGI